MSGCSVKIKSEEAPWSTRHRLRVGQHGPPRAGQGRLLPGAAGRHAAATSATPCRSRSSSRASKSKCITTRSRPRASARSARKLRAARAARRLDADPQVHGVERRAFVRQDGDLHAEAGGRRQRLGHARPPVGVEGRQEPVRRQRLRRALRLRAVLHRRHHQARQGAERDHQPGHQLVQATGAGLRSADQPRLLGAQPLGRVPHPVRVEPERRGAWKCASRIRRRMPTSRSRRC